MKRIIGSFFAIIAIIGAGVLATGAYFQTTDSANNYTFTTGSASLVFGFCPGGTNADCSGVVPNLTTYTFTTSQLTGPDQTGAGCLVLQNTGPYLLHLTARELVTLANPDAMQDAFQVSAQLTNSNCADPSGFAMIYNSQSARAAAALGDVGVADLAPAAKIYILQKNSWACPGNCNALQGGTIKLTTSLTGTTN